jgi:hypothetical protein
MHITRFLVALCVAGLAVAHPAAQGQASPPAEARVTLAGKTISVKYSAPSVRGRKIFGPDGLIAGDATYPVWRAGANSATAFHTDADVTIGTLRVPRGDYTLFVLVHDPAAWQLIVNKQTGQWGLTYDAKQDLGRVKMTMSRPAAPVEQLKYTLTATGPQAATLKLEWEQHAGSVPITLN